MNLRILYKNKFWKFQIEKEQIFLSKNHIPVQIFSQNNSFMALIVG